MRRILLLLPLLACLPALAQTTCQELVPKIMEASGLNRQLAMVPEAMRQVSETQMDREGAMPVDAKRELQSILLHAFDVDRISGNVRAKLVASCEPKAYAAILADMQTPLALKMKQLELEPMSSPEAIQRLQRYIASFPMQSPRESRMNLVYKLMDTTKEAETSTDEALQVTVLMTETAFNVRPSKEQIEETRAEMLSRIRDVETARTYYIYREASDQELQQYTTMLATPEAQELNRDTAKALLFAFTQEATGLANQVKKVVTEARLKHGE